VHENRNTGVLFMQKIISTLTIAAIISISSMLFAHAATPLRIAFVDSGNTGRSMTSEALSKKWAASQNANIVVISRAVNLNPYNIFPEQDFVKLLSPLGIDVSGHRAAQFDRGVVTFSDFIFVMTPAHRDRILSEFPEAKSKVFLMAEYATGSPTEILDAYGQSPEFYARVYQQISELVPLIMAKLPKK
jgi:protein-tyrosine phosphatase